MDDIGGLVRSIRRARGLTQEQLARELGVTFSTVNAWENGRHRPIPALLTALRKLAPGPRKSGRRGTAAASRARKLSGNR